MTGHNRETHRWVSKSGPSYKRSVVVAFAIAAMSLVGTRAASADWQYTKWGMTQDQVVIASSGKATETNEFQREPYKDYWTNPLLTARYKSGRFKFIVFFHFDRQTNKLSRVDLKLDDELDQKLGWQVLTSLKKKYGQPDETWKTTELSVTKAVWLLKLDRVEYFGDQSSAEIQYEPRDDEESKGL